MLPYRDLLSVNTIAVDGASISEAFWTSWINAKSVPSVRARISAAVIDLALFDLHLFGLALPLLTLFDFHNIEQDIWFLSVSMVMYHHP